MAFQNQPGCGCCSPPGQYCLTSATFYGCSDVTGFTITFYDNWTSGTTTPATFEHQEVVNSLPYCYTPANPTHGYGILFSKPGWFDVIVRPGVVNSGTINFTVSLAPLQMQVTHDFGSDTMPHTAATSNPFVGTNLMPSYLGCFEGSAAEIICTSSPFSDTCGTLSGGTFAFTLQMEHNTNPLCAGTKFVRMLQSTPTQACFPGGDTGNPITYHQASSCSGTTLATACASGILGHNEFSPTKINDCGNPFDCTFLWPTSDPCYTSGTYLPGTSSATVTW